MYIIIYMVIEELIPQLPKTKKGIENAYGNCRRLKRFISVEEDEFESHLEKAKSDLSKVKADFDTEGWDWAIIKSYYSVHHAINAMPVRFKGFYSKDHICAILALKYFDLLSEDLYTELRKIHTKFSDFTGFDITYALRKISQYDVKKWKQVSKEDAEAVHGFARKLVSFVEERCYE